MNKKLLEELSFEMNERDVAYLDRILKNKNMRELLNITSEDVKKIYESMSQIGKLKLDGKVYAFHVCDGFNYFENREGQGVRTFLRQGDSLRYFGNERMFRAMDVLDASTYLKQNKINTIYTGDIPKEGSFLGLLQYDNEKYPTQFWGLELEEIEEFNEQKIKVVELEYLI